MARLTRFELLNPLGSEQKGSSIWATIEHLSVPFFQLFLALFFVRLLGVDYYGTWIFVLSLAVVVGALTPGISMAATQILPGLEQSSVQSAAATYSLIFGGLITTLLFSSLAGLILYIYLLAYSLAALDLLAGSGALVVLAVVVNASMIQWDLICSSVLRARLKYRQVAVVDACCRGATVGALIYLITQDMSLLPLLYVNAAMVSARCLIKAMIILREEQFPFPVSLGATIRQIRRHSIAQWLQNLNSVFYTSSDRVVVGFFMQAEMVALAAISSQVAGQLHSIPRAALSPLVPNLVAAREGNGNVSHSELVRRARARFRSVFSIIAPVALLIGPIVIMLVLDSAFTGSQVYSVFICYLIGYSVMALSIVPYFEVIGVGKVALAGLLSILSSFLTLCFAIVLGLSMGVAGIALAKAAYAIPFLVTSRFKGLRV